MTKVIDAFKEAKEESSERVMYDESGNILTEEQAREEESRINEAAEAFFKNHSVSLFNQPTAELEEDEEDDEDYKLKFTEDGVLLEDVTKEKEDKAKETDNVVKEVVPSFIDEQILKRAIRVCRLKMLNAFNKIEATEQEWFYISNGANMYDNIVDAARKERRMYDDLLRIENITLDDIEDSVIKGKVKQEIESLLDAMFAFSKKSEQYLDTLEVLTDE